MVDGVHWMTSREAEADSVQVTPHDGQLEHAVPLPSDTGEAGRVPGQEEAHQLRVTSLGCQVNTLTEVQAR